MFCDAGRSDIVFGRNVCHAHNDKVCRHYRRRMTLSELYDTVMRVLWQKGINDRAAAAAEPRICSAVNIVTCVVMTLSHQRARY